MKNALIARDGWPYILVGLAVTVALYFLSPWLSLPGLTVSLFLCFFFRNPPRRISEDAQTLLSPADGKVMAITHDAHVPELDGPAVRVTIFLSLFNVHINRSPMTGTVFCRLYRAGRYLPAFKSHASEINERNTIGIQQNGRRILIHQITGFIARRIVCDVQPGEQVRQGQRLGMIRFGSCTELVCSPDVEVLVKPGDSVRTGLTALVSFPDESAAAVLDQPARNGGAIDGGAADVP